MDHKTWLWRKKSADKIVVATDHKVDLSSNEEEIQTLLADKAELENDLKILSDKLSSALSECNAKDDLAKKQAKLAKEAMTGQEKAEAKAVSLKQELDEALQQRAAGEQISTHLEAALKECMQQLRFVRQDQEQRIHDAVMKTSNEFERSQMILEEKLAETSKTLADYGNSETLTRKDGSFFPYENTETPSGYMVRVLQWKTSELIAVLQQFAHVCYDLLDGKSDLNMFAQELCSALDWTMNHCFSIQDKKHFDWDESRSGCKAEFVASNGHHSYFEKDECHQCTIMDENKKLREDLINIDSAKRDLEARLQSATNNSESLKNQLKESEKIIGGLQTDLETLRGLKARFESQNENHKLTKEDVDTQLTVARAELNDAHQKLSSLEMELENKRSCCEELEATCLELQFQLESMKKKEVPNSELHQEESQLRTGWEITAASEKLAECQETILNLGKQLKAMASPGEAALFDKVLSTFTDTNTTAVTTSTSKALISTKNKNQRSSLLDQMLKEDSAEVKDTKSINRKESDNNSSPTVISTKVIEPLEKIPVLNGIKHQDDDVAINYLAIVPGKKSGGANLWRKLLWRKKKSNIKIPSFPFAP